MRLRHGDPLDWNLLAGRRRLRQHHEEASVSGGGRAVTGGTDSGTRSGVPRRHVPSTGPFMPPTLGRRHARSESSARDSDCPSLRWLARPRAARAIRVLVRGRPLSSASFTLRIPSLLAITPRVYDGRRRQAHLARGRIRKIKGLLALPWLHLSSGLPCKFLSCGLHLHDSWCPCGA